jgi:hypothetical protein
VPPLLRDTGHQLLAIGVEFQLGSEGPQRPAVEATK